MRRTRLHLLVSVVVGVAAALLAPLPASADPVSRGLVGWVAGALTLAAPLMWRIMHHDADATRARMEDADGGRTETDVVVVLAATAALLGVGVMLIGGGRKSPDQQLFEALVSIAAVASAWFAVHTIYALRYARHWYKVQRDCVDFNRDGDPPMSDFAYLSFTLGMTFQVSDTDLRTPEVRRIVLRHTLLSYLFGTVIVAATINLVAGLAK